MQNQNSRRGTALPADFHELCRDYRGLLRRAPLLSRKRPLVWFPNCLDPVQAKRSLRRLERDVGPHLKEHHGRIPPETVSGMRRNQAEALPKVVRSRTATLNSPRGRATRAARDCGLIELLTSSSLRALAEKVTGVDLEPDPGCQVIAYRPGDYVGPHNDHHPEQAHLRYGYVDVHITLSTPDVAHQYLVWESEGHLSEITDVGVPSGVSVAFLPFWHYTTPLVPTERGASHATRWLLLASYVVESASRKKIRPFLRTSVRTRTR